MRKASAVLAAVAFTVTACTDDDTTEPSSRSAFAQAPFALLTDEDWVLQEAVDPPADAPIATVEKPPLDWYAEYVQSSANESAMVRLSSHGAAINETRATLEDLGFTLDDLSLQRWEAAGGTAGADPASPTIILLDDGPSTLMVLSYDLDLEQLAPIADHVEGVDESAWTAAGGVIQ